MKAMRQEVHVFLLSKRDNLGGILGHRIPTDLQPLENVVEIIRTQRLRTPPRPEGGGHQVGSNRATRFQYKRGWPKKD